MGAAMTAVAIPELLTPRLRLRAFAAADAEPLRRLMAEPGVLRYFPSTAPPDLERVQRFLALVADHWNAHGYGLWAAERREDGRLLGRCGLFRIPDTGETEVDFLLEKPAWGLGLATEAARAALRFGFETQPLELVVGIVHPDHVASQRVLEKLGLKRTARTVYFGMDCFRYAITREERVGA